MTLSPFRYAGAKNRLLPQISTYLDSLLTNASNYSEPFVGGGSVALFVAQKYPNIKLNLNDKDDWVAAFWNVLLDKNKINDLFLLLEHPITIDYFYNLASFKTNNEIDLAYKAIFFNRTCFSGIFKRNAQGFITSSPIGGKKQLSAYKVDCRFNLKKLKEKILLCHDLLKDRAVVTNLDVLDSLEQNKESVTYIDPPYIVAGNALYSVSMSQEEHKNLSKVLLERDNWLLSYDNDPLVQELYKSCEMINISGKYSIKGEKTNWDRKSELLIMKTK